MLPAPCIHQQITGAAVEARSINMGRQIGQIADAADVDDDAMDIRMAQDPVMKGWNQRRALPSRSNVTAAKVADDSYAGQLGEQGCIADLQRVTMLRVVTDGLAVATDGFDYPPSAPSPAYGEEELSGPAWASNDVTAEA